MIALIAAAGSGTRMAAAIGNSKVFHTFSTGQMVLELVMNNIVSSGVCDKIIVATRPEDFDTVLTIARDKCSRFPVSVIRGGSTRQQSVAFALSECPTSTDYVLIHDGARPFCGPESIQRVTKAGRDTQAAILALQSTSTLKFATDRHSTTETLKRELVWAAQTPQVFAYQLFLKAHDAAREVGFEGSDDAQLVERLGHPVELVPGSSNNIKLTTPEDLDYAEFLLASGWGCKTIESRLEGRPDGTRNLVET